MITTLGLAPMILLFGGVQLLPMALFGSITGLAFGAGV